MGIRDLSGADVRAEIVCGFHVLHHLNEENLQMLAVAISSIRERNPRFKGWFFLEPNPLNVLYPLSISSDPGNEVPGGKGDVAARLQNPENEGGWKVRSPWNRGNISAPACCFDAACLNSEAWYDHS